MKARKVVISIPLPVYEFLMRAAQQNYLPLTLYIQRIIVAWAQNAQGIADDFMPAGISTQRAQAAPPTGGKPGLGLTSVEGDRPLLRYAPRRTSSHSSTGLKGVQKYGSRWAAVVYLNGKNQRVGVFNDPATAGRAYDIAARAMLGPNALVNFPEVGMGNAKTGAVEEDPCVEKMIRGEKITLEEWDQYMDRLRATDTGGIAPSPATSGPPKLRPVPSGDLTQPEVLADWIPGPDDD